ncbi:sortase domain-containing protein [Pasteuria penetrans]|uniref:sortase domain-containing protein n=1 Tax=Pasteuria penetrans TaxID=86005 RepID=UPI000FAB88C1|nr:sortase [Pasteuria penetrans]
MIRSITWLLWLIVLGSLGVCGYFSYQMWVQVKGSGTDDPLYASNSMENARNTSPQPTIAPGKSVKKIVKSSEVCPKVMELTFPNRSDRVFDVRLAEHIEMENLCLERGPTLIRRSSQLVFPGEPGLAVISAHRDTSFTFLRRKDLRVGDYAVTNDGETKRVFQVRKIRTLPEKEALLHPIRNKHSFLRITTCYPYVFIGGSPERRFFDFDLVREEKGTNWRRPIVDVSS